MINIKKEFENKKTEDLNIEKIMLECIKAESKNKTNLIKKNKVIEYIISDCFCEGAIKTFKNNINEETLTINDSNTNFIINDLILFQLNGEISKDENLKYIKDIYISKNTSNEYSSLFSTFIIKKNENKVFEYIAQYNFKSKKQMVKANTQYIEGFFDSLCQILNDKKEITTDFIDILNLTEDIKIPRPDKKIEDIIIKFFAENKIINSFKEMIKEIESLNIDLKLKNKEKAKNKNI